MEQASISLAIFGNQNSNSGFQPLYWINDPPQPLENIVPPGMDANPYFFTLQLLSAHTQYTLVQNHVSSYMSARPGVLKIAIAIPCGYQLIDGVSPLDVLMVVREKFIETCMTAQEASTKVYHFNEKLVPPEVFVEVLDSYQLEESRLPHLPMNGTQDAVLLLNDEEIAQLFVNPQCPEFSDFKRIVIGNSGNTEVYGHQIPNMPVSVEPLPLQTEQPASEGADFWEPITIPTLSKPRLSVKRGWKSLVKKLTCKNNN